MKGKTSANAAVFGIVGVLLIGALVTYLASTYGLLNLQAQPGQTIVLPGGAPATPSGADLTFCGGLNTVSTFASERSAPNASAWFLASAFRAANSLNPAVTIATATGTAGTSETLTTVAIPCGKQNAQGVIYSVADTSNNGNYLGAYAFEGERTIKGAGQIGDELRLDIRNIAGDSLSNAALAASPTENATALGATSPLTRIVDFNGGDVGGTQFGNDQGAFVFVDYIRTVAIDSISLGMTGLAEIPDCKAENLPSTAAQLGLKIPAGLENTLAKGASSYSADRCYWMTPQGTRTPLRQMTVSLLSGATDPTTTDDPTINVADNQVFEYKGKIYWGSIDPAGTDVGQTDSVITINLS